MKELDVYTGFLTYKDIDFSFVFDKSELRLIPPVEKANEIHHEWFMNRLAEGVYSWGKNYYIEESFLKGRCNETGQTIVFLPNLHRPVGSYNSVVIVSIWSYFVSNIDQPVVDSISFSCAEINHIFPTNHAIDHIKRDTQGIITVITKKQEDLSSTPQKFVVNDVEIKVDFAILRMTSHNVDCQPLSFHSIMTFEFQPTSEYVFLQKLWYVARGFVRYLCYRNNIVIPTAELTIVSPNNGQHANATMHIISEDDVPDAESKVLSRCITQNNIAGCEGKILSCIADNTIYLRHIPDSFRAAHNINAARFIMITAAFEWEFKHQYAKGRSKNAIKKMDLKDKLLEIAEEMKDITEVFGKRLYSLNHESLVYADMGQRLARQRNNFAHGNLDQKFDHLAVLDLAFTEYLLYAMQLKAYGADDRSIQRSINDLFACNILIPSN